MHMLNTTFVYETVHWDWQFHNSFISQKNWYSNLGNSAMKPSLRLALPPLAARKLPVLSWSMARRVAASYLRLAGPNKHIANNWAEPMLRYGGRVRPGRRKTTTGGAPQYNFQRAVAIDRPSGNPRAVNHLKGWLARIHGTVSRGDDIDLFTITT